MNPWPMIEKHIISHLQTELGVRVATKIPSNVEDLPGFVRVTRGPGFDDTITDSPLIDIESFHVDRETAWDIAESARQALLTLAGSSANGVLIDDISTSTSPNYVFYGPHVERYVASYRTDIRRPISV